MPIDNDANEYASSYLYGELKALNAHVPRKRRTLSELLKDSHPHVACSNGSTHFFKKKELNYLANILDPEAYDVLQLPIMMEISHEEGSITIRSNSSVEAKIFSKILNMTVLCKDNIITIFRPQVSMIRKILKTTTQYAFTVRQSDS